MADLLTSIASHSNLPEDKQKQAGKAISGDMDANVHDFLKLLLKLIDEKKIDVRDHRSFLNEEVYKQLPQMEQDKIDVALMNMGEQLERIVEFRISKETPDSSPQLQTMVLHVWDMKSRIEERAGDVFKF